MNFYLFQVEFVGGPMCWNTRIFSATAGEINFYSNFHQIVKENKNDLVNLFSLSVIKFISNFTIHSLILDLLPSRWWSILQWRKDPS